MALRQTQGITEKMGGKARSAPLVLHRHDLDEQLRLPEVRARLKRVQALVNQRAQQKV